LGGIFVLAPIVLIGSYVGEYYILEQATSRAEKNTKLAVFAALNLAIGVMLWVIPGGYPNKWMSTMSWAVISIGVLQLGMLGFASVDYETREYPNLHPVNKFRITLFKAYGMNPLLVYVLAAAPDLFTGALPAELQLVIWAIMVPAISIIAYALSRKNTVISTPKVAFAVVILLLVLAVILRSMNFF
jgi:hypothetical protein